MLQKILSIPSRIDEIDRAVNEAVNFAASFGFDSDSLYAIDIAVREAVANAVKHGNGLDEKKKVEIIITALVEGIEVRVRDSGNGFDPDSIPDPTKPENLLKSSGRGILFMRSFMEEVEWIKDSKGGMTVRMCKFLKKDFT